MKDWLKEASMYVLVAVLLGCLMAFTWWLHRPQPPMAAAMAMPATSQPWYGPPGLLVVWEDAGGAKQFMLLEENVGMTPRYWVTYDSTSPSVKLRSLPNGVEDIQTTMKVVGGRIELIAAVRTEGLERFRSEHAEPKKK